MAAVAFAPLAHNWDALGAVMMGSGTPSPSADSLGNYSDEEIVRRALEGTSPMLPRARLPDAPAPAWLPPPPMGSASLVQHSWSPSPPISQGPWSGLGFAAAPFAQPGNVWSPQPQQSSPAMSQNGFVSGPWDTASVLATMNAQHQHMVATGLVRRLSQCPSDAADPRPRLRAGRDAGRGACARQPEPASVAAARPLARLRRAQRAHVRQLELAERGGLGAWSGRPRRDGGDGGRVADADGLPRQPTE